MRLLPALLLGALAILACSGQEPGNEAENDAMPHGVARGRSEAREGEPVAAGSLVLPEVLAMYGVILPDGVDGDAAQKAMAADLAAAPTPVAPPGSKPALVELVDVPELPYNAQFLLHFGVGIGASDEAGLGRALDALRITIPVTPTARMEAEHRAAALALASAERSGGWLQDLWTNQTFSRAAFAVVRPADGLAEVERLVLVHMVEEVGGGVLLDTAGLARFGLPELVIHGVPRTFASQLTTVLNAAAQTLIEKGGLPRDGELDVNAAALTTAPWPQTAQDIAASGGTGRITLGVRWGADDDRAPDWEMELVLPGSGDAAGRAYEAVKFVEPPEQEMIYAKDGDPELEAARDRARTKLKAMAGHFAKGVPEGEQLNVKGPFTTTDGQIEWMWVEVTAWKGDMLSGILLNDPFGAMNVHAGDRVEIAVSDAFDYAWKKSDGSVEGDETTAILVRREGR